MEQKYLHNCALKATGQYLANKLNDTWKIKYYQYISSSIFNDTYDSKIIKPISKTHHFVSDRNIDRLSETKRWVLFRPWKC